MKKILLLAYNGELTCFAHVMLYALDFDAKGYEVKVIIEGMATRLLPELASEGAPFANVYRQLKEKGLLACTCNACAQKMGTLEEAERQGVRVVGDMQGHPSIEAYLKDGYEIVSF